MELHADKCQIYQTEEGVTFLGYKIYPTHRLVIRRNIKRLNKRVKKYYGLLAKGIITKQKIICSLQSWLGYALHADTFNLRKRIASKYHLSGLSP